MEEEKDQTTETQSAENRENLNNFPENNTPEVVQKHVSKLKVFFIKHKKAAIISGIVLVILILFGIGFYFLRNEAPKSITEVKPDSSGDTLIIEEGETFANVLDGLMVSKDVANRHPLAIVIENHVDSRPQAGLDKASIVYEAIAEGGITRFLALFSTNEAEKVGPVRSVRTFFVDWAHGYNAFLAHVGGNMDALDQIKAEKTYDLDQFAYSSSYWREYAAGIATEHTMYTSTVKLREQAAKNGYPTANNFSIYKFKDDPDKITLPESQKVNVTFSNATYNTTFDYDKATNSYKRSMAGKPHLDKMTKDQITSKNVIVMTVARKSVLTRINEPGYSMTTTGSGKAKIFLDGKIIEGTWKKTSAADREIFYDENGLEVVFNRGQFWISVIPPESGSSVSVQ